MRMAADGLCSGDARRRVEKMSLHEYRMSLELSKDDPPFYALIMAAMRKADTDNTEKFKAMWPEVWDELYRRYHAPGGILPDDGPQCTCCGNPECEDCPSECPVHGGKS
jgi:hypothetical protein